MCVSFLNLILFIPTQLVDQNKEDENFFSSTNSLVNLVFILFSVCRSINAPSRFYYRVIQRLFRLKRSKYRAPKVMIPVYEVCASLNWPRCVKCHRTKQTKRLCHAYRIRQAFEFDGKRPTIKRPELH